MRLIDGHRVRFCELAGNLVSGYVFFDWTADALQRLAREIEYPFSEILEEGGLPYAPVSVQAVVDRYPGTGEEIAVDVYPASLGDHHVELYYEFLLDGTEPIAQASVTHVCVDSTGNAVQLPERSKERLADFEEKSPIEDIEIERHLPETGPITSFYQDFTVRTPHIEGANLAYFDQYPKYATISIESYLESRGRSLGSLTDPLYPFRPRSWNWEFTSPVMFETVLRVRNGVIETAPSGVLLENEFINIDGDQTSQPSITGWTEYGCFTETGQLTEFPEPSLDAIRDT